MSAQNTLLTAVRANERGAFEYLPKPFDLNELISVVDRALAETKGATPEFTKSEAVDELPLIGRSNASAGNLSCDGAADDHRPDLITANQGPARNLSPELYTTTEGRKEGPFVAINMAAIPRELIESELFGHERGAFTGAVGRYAGRFEQANGGTLFLDEIGDMPMEAQTRLLRVLQEGEFTTVGGRTSLRANARIVAATHRDLHALVGDGVFREDLYYRLNVVPIRLPPLRERLEDIPELVRHFLDQTNAEGLPEKVLGHRALERLQQYHWPKYSRIGRDLVRRLTALYAEETVGEDAIVWELPDISAPKKIAEDEGDGVGVGTAVAYHLETYFKAHGGGSLPSGLYERILHESRTSADFSDASGDEWKSD